MKPESLIALKYIAESTKPMTIKQFTMKYDANTLNTILSSHVEELKGKLVLTEAGKSVLGV